MGRVCVIMAGGSGERFWPASRKERPKQFLRLGSANKTLFEEAIDRAGPLFGMGRLFVATSQVLRKAIVDTGLVAPSQVLAEPLKRNTLGALVWATARLIANGFESETVAILTADHRIGNVEAFRKCVTIALDVAEKTSGLVALGIPITRPETGYGYVEAGESLSNVPGVLRVESFHEKPDLARAEEYRTAGSFFWNSGMFFWTIPAFLAELELAEPKALEILNRIAGCVERGDEAAAETSFSDLPDVSVDYALMERSKNAYVVPAEFAWDDVGAWDTLERSLEVDEFGNAKVGEVELIDSRGCVVYNDSSGSVAAVIGVEDVIVAVTDDAVLVCRKDQAQKVRDLVERLKRRNDPRV